MKRLLAGIVFGVFVFSLHGAAEQSESLISVLSSRLVDPKTREITKPVQDLLEATHNGLFFHDLPTVVRVIQKQWILPDGDVKRCYIKQGVDIDAARRLVDSLFIERAGGTVPRVLCQGGGLATMLPTCAAICKIAHEFPESALQIFFAYRGLPVHFIESAKEHYRAVLHILGRRDAKHLENPKSFPELVAFFKHAFPDLQRCDIMYLDMDDKAKLDSFKSSIAGTSFCVAAAPLQAAVSIHWLQAIFPGVTLTGIQTIGAEAAKMCEPLYADAGTPTEQLAERLHYIGRELLYTNYLPK